MPGAVCAFALSRGTGEGYGSGSYSYHCCLGPARLERGVCGGFALISSVSAGD